jgi:hypothetical protein
MTGLVSFKFADTSHGSDRSHREKGETGHLQPELVQDLSE